MSPFPHRQPQPISVGSLRLWLVPIATGFAAECLLAGSLLLLGSNSTFGPLLLLVIASVLGWLFGSRRGAVASVLPIVLLVIAELIRQAFGGSGGANPISTILIGVAMALVLAFCAFLAGAIRARYHSPRSGSQR